MPQFAFLRRGSFFLLMLALSFSALYGVWRSQAVEPGARVIEAYGRLPLGFEENRGQADAGVAFLARGEGYGVFLTGAGMRLALREGALAFTLAGANPRATARGIDPLPGRSHYFRGNDPARWVTNVAQYARVKVEAVYPGIDLVYYGNQRQLEYDFLVAPGADPGRIEFALDGADGLRLNAEGDLLIEAPGGELIQRRPFVYQEVGGERRQVAGRHRIVDGNRVAFEIGAYDRSLPLVIDPVLVYASVLGGNNGETAYSVAVDAEGNAYLAGETSSTDFPTASTLQPAVLGVDAMILKMNAAGTALVYATWLGGDFNDAARGIAVDGAGNAYVAGSTESLNFPTTPGALARQLPAQSAAFVARLNAQGSALIYSTYFDSAQSIAVDAGGNAFVAGTTSATDFPIANLTNARIGRPLYKTTNAGGNWSAVTGAPPSNQVLAFAIDPKTPTTMYAGTTTGVYKSANGGATWTRPGTGEFAALPSIDIEIDPVDTNIVYSATGGSVLRSNDGGVTWQVKYNGVTNAFQNFDLAIDPKSPKNLYVGTEIGVFVTNNGGDGWGPLNNGLSGIGFPNPPRVRKIAIDPVNSSTIYISTSRNVFKTTDSGAIWNPANTGLGGGLSEAPLIAIDPASPQTLYAALLTGLYKSTNGGGNWSAINNGLSAVINGLTTVYRINALAIDPTSPMTLYAGTNGFGVFKSVNGGASWSASNTGLNNRLVSALAIDRASAATLWAGTNAGADLLVAKLAPAGNALGFFKVLGGYENDFVRGLALDKAGDVYLAGQTSSPNFPALNAFQGALAGSNDGFAMKLSGQDGVILYSTYLGGAGNDEARGVAVDGAGNAVVVGRSTSTNFPLLNPIRPANTAPQLFDAFVTKLNPAGSGLVYSTLLGGASGDEANAVAVDSAGNAYVGGQTSSLDFPAIGATQSALAAGLDGFVTRLNAAGSQILFSTWLGGGSTDQVNSIAVDATRGIYVVGGTSSANFPTQNPLPLPPNRRLPDAFLAKLASSADLAITNEESRDPAMINTELSYTITVTNAGPDPAESATVANPLPAGAGFVSATTTRGSCANASGTVTCTLGDLPANASATITLTIKTPAAAGTLRSTATATAATSDPDPADNSAAQETRVADRPSIAGRVTLANGSGLAGATVALAGAQTATAQTGPTGRYQFAELPPGSYTVTPAQPGVVFVPASRSYPALAMDQTADFAATSCVLTLTPTNAAIGAQGGPGTIAIAAPNASCPWTARTDASWISFTTPTSGSGSGNLGFSVAPTTAARSAVIEIGGSVFTVRQEVNPCAVPGIAVAPRIFAGRGPTALAAGDFNGDGKSDLATGDNDGMIALLLGDGAGGFAAPATFPVTDAPIGLVAADFDNDGRLDLAGIVSRSAENVFVVFGTGTGRFGEPQKYTAGSAPAVIAATDLNGDNRPELLIANRTPVNLSVLLNQGGGQFGARVSYGNAADPNSIATGDFNGDGRRDVAVAGSAGIDVFYGNNLGAFASITRFTTGSAPRHMVAGDVTGDGRADLLIAVNTLDKGGAIDILKGGEGGFDGSARVPIFTESFASWGALPAPDSLATGDLNSDGKLDLVAVYGHAGIAPLLGNGAAGFATGGLFTSGLFLQHAVVRDFNGDGRADAVASTPGLVSDSAGVLSLFASDAVGGFAAPRAYYAPAGPTSSLLADVNRDGKADLLALTGTCGNQPCPNDGIVTLRLGDGAGGFGAPATYRVGLDPASFATGDFNGDGRFDLVVGNARSKNLSTLTGAADGGFNPATTTLLPDEPTAMAAGDFNGDNRLDLAVASSPFSSGVYRLYLLLGDGAGGFAAPVSFVSESPLLSLHAADFNRDGRADLVAATRGCGASSSRIYLFPGRADGTFGEPFRAPEGQGATAMRSADLNGDGRLDLVAVDPCAPEAQAVRVYFGDGAGALAAPMSYPLTPGGAPDPPARELLLADLNSDGRLDAVLNNRTFDSVEVLLGTAASGFGPPTLFPSGSSTTSIAVGDLNGDGRPDVVAGNRLSSTQTVLLNACRASGSAATVSAASYANPPLASEQIAALFGLNLATSTQLGSTVPLPTSLAGTTVRVRDSAGVDRLAPLFFVSTGQINYLVPPAVAPGPATITITNGAGAASALATQFAPVAPGLFSANANGQGVAAAVALRVKASGAQTFESIATFDATANRFVPLPIDLGPEGDQVYLLLYGTGLRNRRDLSTVTVRIGGFAPSLLYAGPQGDLVGLDQVNLLLPRSLAGRGLVDITLSADQRNANVVQIQVK
ncbi:MAG: FG-GAP-like repeat-containing protein [Blastocatellia bacterium]|nr:FG-GAP-like repeat-containing protein [Blastocatellia bacterium]